MNGRYLVTAGPGTGKTTALVRQAADCVEHGQAPVVVTFSRRAARELDARLRAELRTRGQILPQESFVGTLDAWTGRIARGPHSNHLQLSAADVERLKTALGIQPGTVEWRALLRAGDAVDYETAREEAAPKVRTWAPGQPLFVDEAQDLSDAQLQLVQEAARDRAFCAVGDPRQLIYSWRDASEETWKRLSAGRGVEHRTLTTSYRAGPRIVQALNRLQAHAHLPGRELEAANPQRGGDVFLGGDAVARVRALAADGEQVAVLCRQRRALQAWAQAMESCSPTLHSPIDDPWDTGGGAVAALVLRLVLRPRHPLLSLLLAAAAGISKVGLRAAWAEAAAERRHVGDVLRQRFPELEPRFQGVTLGERLQGLRHPGVERWFDAEALSTPVDLLDMDLTCGDAPGRMLRLGMALDAFGAWWAQHEERTPEIVAGVNLLTVHGAKGLEFDHVVLPDVDDRTYGVTNPEDARILYVAASRARESLFVSWAPHRQRSWLLPAEL